MPTVTTRKQRHNKRKETTKKPTRQSRRLGGGATTGCQGGRWTTVSRVHRREVANMNTRKTKGGSLTNFWTQYGNCDIAYENKHPDWLFGKSPKELELSEKDSHETFDNAAVLCGSLLSYNETTKTLCIERKNDGRHRSNLAWFRKRSYFLPYIRQNRIKKNEVVEVTVGLGIEQNRDPKMQIEKFQASLDATFKNAKEKSRAIITNITGTQNVSYTFSGYSCNAVQTSESVTILQEKEPHVLFTVDVRRSRTRDEYQRKKQQNQFVGTIEEIIKKMKNAINVSVCAFDSAEFTIETRIKIIYSILFLKEYAYQVISTLLIFFELHELIKDDTDNVRDVHRLILEFYYGRLSERATVEMQHIQEECAKKFSFHIKAEGVAKPRKKTTAELTEKLNQLKNTMAHIQAQGIEKINMFTKTFNRMDEIVLKHKLEKLRISQTTVSALTLANEQVLKEIKKKGCAPTLIKDDEFSYYTYCMYMLKTFNICKEIIGARVISAAEWGNPQELLQQMLQSIHKITIVNTDAKDHELFEVESFEKMKATVLKFDTHAMDNIVHICNERRKYTDYIRQKLSLYQNVCFRKVSEELLRRYYNQTLLLNKCQGTIKDKEKDMEHKEVVSQIYQNATKFSSDKKGVSENKSTSSKTKDANDDA